MSEADPSAPNVLLSSAGRRVSLLRQFRQAVQPHGGRVIATDMSALAPAMHVADASVVVPRISSPEFLERLLEVVHEHQVRLLVPTLDTELPVLAANRERFAEVGCHVAIAGPAAIDVCADKSTTHRWFIDNDIPTVRQATPVEVMESPQDWPWPLLVKPARGSASAGVHIVHGVDQLRSCAQDDIVQTIATGNELTIDVFVDRSGAARCAVPRRRLEVRAGEVSKAVTIAHPAAEALAMRIGELLDGANGAVTVQLFADGDDLRVIEINPRFGGGFPLSWHAGARFPEWMVEESLGRSLEIGTWRADCFMVRYDQELIFDGDPS